MELDGFGGEWNTFSSLKNTAPKNSVDFSFDLCCFYKNSNFKILLQIFLK